MSTPIKRAGKFFVLRLLSYVADGKEFIHSLKKWNTEFVSFKFGGKHSTQKLLLLALEGRKKNQGCQPYISSTIPKIYQLSKIWNLQQNAKLKLSINVSSYDNFKIAKVGNTEILVMLMHGLHPLFFCRSKMMKERNTTQEVFFGDRRTKWGFAHFTPRSSDTMDLN